MVDEYVEVECDGDKITLTKTTPPEAKKHYRYSYNLWDELTFLL